MSQFQVSDRVLAVVPNGVEFEIVEGFVTAIEKDGNVVAVRPATTHEWEEGKMEYAPDAVSWWWDSCCVYHVVDAEDAVDSLSRMNETGLLGGNDNELGSAD